jgi:CubicO group peptidase (beta-lactamase class C family)
MTSSLFEASGVSIGVKSIHEDSQLFSFHYTPPVKTDIGTDEIDENTIYRVGSVSKMMPALAAIQVKEINLDDSILVYLPELENATSSDAVNAISWEDITVRSLANHLSGLATDCE